jgi:LPXTG-motif cell wall-anchored protein
LQWSRVSAGDDTNCAVTDGSSLYCWGWNGTYVVGDGSTENRLLPVLVLGNADLPETNTGSSQWSTALALLAALTAAAGVALRRKRLTSN